MNTPPPSAIVRAPSGPLTAEKRIVRTAADGFLRPNSGPSPVETERVPFPANDVSVISTTSPAFVSLSDWSSDATSTVFCPVFGSASYGRIHGAPGAFPPQPLPAK